MLTFSCLPFFFIFEVGLLLSSPTQMVPKLGGLLQCKGFFLISLPYCMWRTNSLTLIVVFIEKKKKLHHSNHFSFSPFSDKMPTLSLLDWLYLCTLAINSTSHRAWQRPMSLQSSTQPVDLQRSGKRFPTPLPLPKLDLVSTNLPLHPVPALPLLSRLPPSCLPTEDLDLLRGSFPIITFWSPLTLTTMIISRTSKTLIVPTAQKLNLLPGETHSVLKTLLDFELEADLDSWDPTSLWGPGMLLE